MPLIFKHRHSNLDPAEWAESIWRSEAVAFVFGFHPWYVSGQEIQRQQRSEERSVHGASTRAPKCHEASASISANGASTRAPKYHEASASINANGASTRAPKYQL
uniref:hypothetical protein n=1 Tax=Paenibacillus terrae TaxID=159743 RepID=UPI001643A3D6|nr:hypothetical protein [Paenibacillus terrae]